MKIEPGYTADKYWNYFPPLPLKMAPYFDRPRNFGAMAVHWLRMWHPRNLPISYVLQTVRTSVVTVLFQTNQVIFFGINITHV